MIRLEQVSVTFPGFSVRDISLQVAAGEFFALLGPTGAGKTVILESIAGLVQLTKGRIRVAGRDMTHLPPERRRIGIVYQDYALFPHLTVMENIRYGLRYHGIDPSEGRRRIDHLIELLGLQRIVSRRPLHLSGGEKQRVCLARALSVNPQVLLLDEPLSALDPNFREEIRRALKDLHRELGVTFMMVTHDFNEALCLAGRVGIIREGVMEQVGATEEIFERPATPFVANFVGMKNIFEGRFYGELAEFGGLRFSLAAAADDGRYLALRPEDVVISRAPSDNVPDLHFPGEIARIVPLGFVHEISVRCRDVEFVTYLDRKNLFRNGFEVGDAVVLGFDPAAVHIF
jgi:molybdate/tungstate transport system ATP-binding protein